MTTVSAIEAEAAARDHIRQNPTHEVRFAGDVVRGDFTVTCRGTRPVACPFCVDAHPQTSPTGEPRHAPIEETP